MHDTSSERALQMYEVWLKNTSNGYQVIEWTRNGIANDQRGITPKISKAELWFSCMTHHLNLRYKCMKFRRDISYGFHVIERTQFCDRQTDRWTGLGIEKFRKFKVPNKGPFVSKNGQTDGQTQAEKQYLSQPFQGGRHNYKS